MSTEPFTYQQLDQLLQSLGFSRRQVEPKWLRYEHTASDTVIILVEKRPDELVRPTDALSARLHLLEKGLLTEQQLEAML